MAWSRIVRWILWLRHTFRILAANGVDAVPATPLGNEDTMRTATGGVGMVLAFVLEL